jgi:Ca2+/Na+ antiporter
MLEQIQSIFIEFCGLLMIWIAIFWGREKKVDRKDFLIILALYVTAILMIYWAQGDMEMPVTIRFSITTTP